MPTMGLFRRMLPVDPENTASPKANTPPSEATNQYPAPVGVAAIPTMGLFRRMLPVDPEKTASPKANTPPSEATSQ